MEFRVKFIPISSLLQLLWKHTTTGEVPKFVMDNFNDSLVKERVEIGTEKSRKKHLEKKAYIKLEMLYWLQIWLID